MFSVLLNVVGGFVTQLSDEKQYIYSNIYACVTQL